MLNSEMLLRVKALRIPVSNLVQSLEFYCNSLGLKLGKFDNDMRTATLLPNLPHGSIVELVEVDVVRPLHFYVKDGYLQPIIRFHASDLEGMFMRLQGTTLTDIHQDRAEDGCGRYFEAADPDGTWLQYHVNIGESVIMEGTTEAVVNVEIPVSDVLQSVEFYNNIGFTLEREPTPEIAFLNIGHKVDRFGYLNIAEFGIILTRRDAFPLMRFERNNAWEPVIVLQTDDLVSYQSKLLESGIKVCNWQNGFKQNSLHLSDPDGHRLGINTIVKIPQEAKKYE